MTARGTLAVCPRAAPIQRPFVLEMLWPAPHWAWVEPLFVTLPAEILCSPRP